ncbi:SMI1/KNR4 family protein [Tsukamurella sputi]|uniref:SMI1/KNR4 family protein n=1 Tax=Tsukamurella sputi TaxID=2591848 RepID=A0A5C5RKU8_9ACTN|nr:SMI1/KNR4 family protein [Tsukamurella sputi]TWS23340.1 SMI1/KNR4 family protein [Tsukamurella sputi]
MEPEQVWSHEQYEPYIQEPLTPESLAAAEQELGVRLPFSLVALLMYRNGGPIRVTLPHDRDFDILHETIRGIGEKFPHLAKEAWWQWPDEDEGVPIPPDPHWLISFDGGGHWDLCLDYRHSPTDTTGLGIDPAVTVIDTERIEIEYPVAESFDAYLADLIVSPDEE